MSAVRRLPPAGRPPPGIHRRAGNPRTDRNPVFGPVFHAGRSEICENPGNRPVSEPCGMTPRMANDQAPGPGRWPAQAAGPGRPMTGDTLPVPRVWAAATTSGTDHGGGVKNSGSAARWGLERLVRSSSASAGTGSGSGIIAACGSPFKLRICPAASACWRQLPRLRHTHVAVKRRADGTSFLACTVLSRVLSG